MKAPSYLTPALPCLLSLLLGVPVAVQGGKGSSCSKAYCCTADDSESFTTFFLLEFKDNFPSSPQCQSVRRNMERQFVLSYNYIARLNCDFPCFRRATAARIVAAPENAFVHCGGSGSPDPGLPPIPENVNSNKLVVELDVEQAGGCTSALDGTVGEGYVPYPDKYESCCQHPAWAWEVEYYQDACPVQSVDSETCCCHYKADRSLAEEDLQHVYANTKTITKLSGELVMLRELFQRSDCSPQTVDFSSLIIFQFSGDATDLDQGQANDFATEIQSEYNTFNFDKCDTLGRRINMGLAANVPAQALTGGRRLQFQLPIFANPISNSSCPLGLFGCVEGLFGSEARCSPAVCPQQDFLDLLELNFRRRLSKKQSLPDDGSHLRTLQWSSAAPVEFISEECLCPTFGDLSGTSATGEQFVTGYNGNLNKPPSLNSLGTMEKATEYSVYPSAGKAKQGEIWIAFYLKGSPCQLDVNSLQDFGDVVQVSYNDMVVEDCDRPLFRKITSTLIWIDDDLKCSMNEFVIHVCAHFVCHGYCNKYDPLFSEYNDRRFLEESSIFEEDVSDQFAPYNHAQRFPVLQNHEDYQPYQAEPESQIDRRLGSSGPDGLCLARGDLPGIPPSVSGLETRINATLPLPYIDEASVSMKPVCRCEEFKGEYYHDKPPSKPKYFGHQNGIFVIPFGYGVCHSERRLQVQTSVAFTCP